MRIVTRFVVIFFVLVFVFLPSCCKKTEPSDSDYTERYLGNWNFHYSWSRTKYGLINITSGESYDYTGTINPGPKKNYLTIVYSGVLLDKKVEPDGRILNTCSEGAPLHWSISCSGFFDGDSILHYNTNETSPPNQVTDYSTELIGIKQGKNIQCWAPKALTTAAAGVTASGAILEGIVNPNFLPTTVVFQYGTMKGSYIFNVSATSGIISGSVDFNENAAISKLASGTEYYFRIVAFNSFGTTYGSEMTFTTTK
jgi:hypothetical protein